MVAAEQPTEPGSVAFQQTTPTNGSPANNSTVQHEDPDSVDESGDTAALQRWLSGDLAQRLDQSAVEISQDDYQRGQALLNDDFQSRLDQYVDVAGDTDSETDDQVGERIRGVATEQRAYAETLSEYETTYKQYQQARQNGNTTATRQYARTLLNQSADIRELNRSLITGYSELNQSGVRTDQAAERISNTTREVIATQAQIQADTFVETRLTLSAPDTTASFTDPLPVTGQLTTANGTAVANRSVRIRIFERTYTATTNRTGAFTIQYRPVALPVTATNTTVAYRPNATAPYLGTENTVPITVTQVSPSLTTTVRESPVRFGERVQVTARVTVAGRPVPALPVTMRVPSRTTNRTTANGTTQLRPRVPAAVPTGQLELPIGHERQGLAVGPVQTTTDVRIAPAATTLTAAADTTTSETITVTGTLRTSTGTPVPNQPVTVVIGEAATTTITNATGTYRQQVTIPETALNGSVTTITVRFSGSGTNLEPTQTTTQASVPQASAGDGASRSAPIQWVLGSAGDGASRSAPIQWVLAGVVVVGVALGGYLWQRRRAAQATPESGNEENTEDTVAADDSVTAAQQWLTSARANLAGTTETDPTATTVAAYAALRAAVERYDDLPSTLTHREFRSACEAHIDGIDPVALDTVIDGYEQAVFAQTIDVVEVEDVVTAAEELIQHVRTDT
jgi:hypothetical protein